MSTRDMNTRENSAKTSGWSLVADIAIILAINVQMTLAACVVAQAVAAPAIAEPAQRIGA